MLELLGSAVQLVLGLLSSVWSIISSVSEFALELLVWLHVSSPRLEGLLVGVLLAWIMLRRDRHPLLRVLSSPLKLVVDILDLAWAQVVEVWNDIWGTAKNWVMGSIGWVKGKISSSYQWSINLLKDLKNKLLSKKENNK